MSFLEGWGIKYVSFLELVFNGIQSLLEGGGEFKMRGISYRAKKLKIYRFWNLLGRASKCRISYHSLELESSDIWKLLARRASKMHIIFGVNI